jgi:hypothetical protein
MGVSRSRLRTLEQAAARDLDSFMLKNGKRYYFDRVEASLAIFMYGVSGAFEREPVLPAFLRIILHEAQDPRAVLETFRSGNPQKMFVDPLDLLEGILDLSK